ncbi:MAG: hypothetical protein J6I55_01555 [Ruminococcus sp.]|nr:hypothetical protein [Ruminococcus sp.]
MKKHIFKISAAIVSAILICGNMPFSVNAGSTCEGKRFDSRTACLSP